MTKWDELMEQREFRDFLNEAFQESDDYIEARDEWVKGSEQELMEEYEGDC